mmetsp:Transcript_86041/g.229612  ORF Transcript_86041/g.229612 Transcript_86041/m.229612 type:complete len:104 (-) Transcript_86041:499-810(-)
MQPLNVQPLKILPLTFHLRICEKLESTLWPLFSDPQFHIQRNSGKFSKLSSNRLQNQCTYTECCSHKARNLRRNSAKMGWALTSAEAIQIQDCTPRFPRLQSD